MYTAKTSGFLGVIDSIAATSQKKVGRPVQTASMSSPP